MCNRVAVTHFRNNITFKTLVVPTSGIISFEILVVLTSEIISFEILVVPTSGIISFEILSSTHFRNNII